MIFITEQQIITKHWAKSIDKFPTWCHLGASTQLKPLLLPITTFNSMENCTTNSNIKLSLQLTIHLLMPLSTMKDWIQVETELDMVILHAMLFKISHQELETKLS